MTDKPYRPEGEDLAKHRKHKLPTVEQLRAALYVNEDGELFWLNDRPGGLGTMRKRAGDRAGFKAISGYWTLSLGSVNMQAHRVVWALTYGEWPPGILDHIDRDRANNRPSNLRLATRSQNAGNTTKWDGPLKGVAKVRGCARWTAKITVNKHQRYLGIFKTPEEAAAAYQAAAKEVRGEFYVGP